MIIPPIPEDEAQRLRQLRELRILDTPAEQAYDDLTRIASKICGTPMALVSLVDEHRQWFKSRQGMEDQETHRDLSFCAHAILDAETMIVEDAARDERFHDHPHVTGHPNILFYAGTPLVVNQCRVGTLCVLDNTPRRLAPEALEALEALARQVESQLALRLRVQELEELDQLKDEFVGMVSHELRTPLTAIHAALTMLTKGLLGPLEGKAREMVEVAYRNALRLLKIVDDILDLTQIEAGRFEVVREPVEIGGLAEEAVALHQSYCAQYDCTLRARIPDSDGPLVVSGDRERLLQVLGNFISNAAKFTHRGDQIEVLGEVAGDRVRLGVRDHGPGIPDEFSKLVFEKFATVNGSRAKAPGTGLGLHISRQIVELHEGQVGWENASDGGCFFYLDMPLLPRETGAG